MTFCISTYNNNNYLQLAIRSVRNNSHFKDAPFVVYAENCNDGFAFGSCLWFHLTKKSFLIP